MTIASISLLRHRVSTSLTSSAAGAGAILHRAVPYVPSISVAAKQNPSSVSHRKPSKNLLRAREVVKQFSSIAPVLSPADLPPLPPSQAVGMVTAAQANFMRVVVHSPPSDEASRSVGEGLDEGSGSGGGEGVELLCLVKAVLKKIRRRVFVGDKVLVGSIDWVDRRGMIENVFQRSSEIVDPPVANVDRLLVLFSMEQPKLEAFWLTRFLVEAESTGMPLTLALNKSELATEEALMTWKSRLCSWGYDPIFCSVDLKHGLDTLASTLKEQTTVLVGPSGVGKSSLINALRSNQPLPDASEGDNWFDHIIGSKWFENQRVGEVSKRSGRGKHTTRHVSLLPLSEGGYLADTPGFSQPSLMKLTKHSLAKAFPEITGMLSAREPANCAFSNCLHLGEPGCVIKGDWERYPYYLQLLDEIKIREEFQLRTVGTKREGDVRYKVGNMGVKQAEPRLDLKKHRRQSRKSINQSMLAELDELDDDNDDDDNLEPMEFENK